MNTEVPVLDTDESNYAHCQVTERVPVSADQFFAWYMKQPIEAFMLGTAFVSPIIGTEPLEGPAFGAIGSRRKIFFKDGTVASEAITSADFPRAYSYLPYAYNNPIRLFSDYAKATMSVVPDGDQTLIVWDYAFHARNRMGLQVVKLFVKLDWARNLGNALKVIRKHLETHGANADMTPALSFKIAA